MDDVDDKWSYVQECSDPRNYKKGDYIEFTDYIICEFIQTTYIQQVINTRIEV